MPEQSRFENVDLFASLEAIMKQKARLAAAQAAIKENK